MAEQLKVIILVPFITIFITFTSIWSTNQPYYESTAKILLPKNQSAGGLAGLASQFGVNVSQSAIADLSSPSLFPELLKSRTFAERIMGEKFYVEKYQKKLSLLVILTHGTAEPIVGRDTLINSAIGAFQKMVTFIGEGSFSLLTVKASEPHLARDINVKVLDELQKLNRHFKSKNVNEKIEFIQSRIVAVGDDLENSEQRLKLFREQNRQVSSPALQLDQERLSRDVDIQKGIFLTLKQQQELANIEKIQNETIMQVLDKPQVPFSGKRKNLKLSILLAGILGIGLGIMIGFIRAYADNSDMDERKKLRRVKHLFKKKIKDIFLDQRVSGIISILLLMGLPFYLGHESKNPVFFGRYSPMLMVVNTVYLIVFLFSTGLFIRLTRNNSK